MSTKNKLSGYGLILASSAGLFASLASLSAKLAVTDETVKEICQILNVLSEIINWPLLSSTCSEVLICVLRVCCFCLMFAFNALMWTTFTKSLQYFTSTVEASATNTACNFTFSAIFGWLFFNENLPLQWWIGCLCIVIGLYLIQSGNTKTHPLQENKAKIN